jgi:hypothetical protein
MYKLEMQITGGGVITIETFDFDMIRTIQAFVQAFEESEWNLVTQAKTPTAPTKRRGRPPGVKNIKVKK